MWHDQFYRRLLNSVSYHLRPQQHRLQFPFFKSFKTLISSLLIGTDSVSEGMLPNRFPDDGTEPTDYDNADGTVSMQNPGSFERW